MAFFIFSSLCFYVFVDGNYVYLSLPVCECLCKTKFHFSMQIVCVICLFFLLFEILYNVLFNSIPFHFFLLLTVMIMKRDKRKFYFGIPYYSQFFNFFISLHSFYINISYNSSQTSVTSSNLMFIIIILFII